LGGKAKAKAKASGCMAKSKNLGLRPRPNTLELYHRLNGSSSFVLTATPHSYGKGQNSTPYKIETPERIETKFDTVDYVPQIQGVSKK